MRETASEICLITRADEQRPEPVRLQTIHQNRVAEWLHERSVLEVSVFSEEAGLFVAVSKPRDEEWFEGFCAAVRPDLGGISGSEHLANTLLGSFSIRMEKSASGTCTVVCRKDHETWPVQRTVNPILKNSILQKLSLLLQGGCDAS